VANLMPRGFVAHALLPAFVLVISTGLHGADNLVRAQIKQGLFADGSLPCL